MGIDFGNLFKYLSLPNNKMVQSKLEQLLEKARPRRVTSKSYSVSSPTETSPVRQRSSLKVLFNYTRLGLNFLHITIEFGRNKDPFGPEEIARLASDFGGYKFLRMRFDDSEHNDVDIVLGNDIEYEAEIYAVSKIKDISQITQKVLDTFRINYRLQKALGSHSNARVDNVVFSKSQPFLYISPERIMKAYKTRGRWGHVVENRGQNSGFLYTGFVHEGYNNVSLEIFMDMQVRGAISAQHIHRLDQAIKRNGYDLRGTYFVRDQHSVNQRARQIII